MVATPQGSPLSIAGFGISETAIYGLARWLDTKEIPTASLPEDLPKTGNEVLFLEARIHRTACSRDSGGPFVTKASDGKYLQLGLILGTSVQKCLAEKEWEKQDGIMLVQSFENHLEWIETTCKKYL